MLSCCFSTVFLARVVPVLLYIYRRCYTGFWRLLGGLVLSLRNKGREQTLNG